MKNIKTIVSIESKHIFIFGKKDNFLSLFETFLTKLGFENPLQYKVTKEEKRDNSPYYKDLTNEGTMVTDLTSTYWDFVNENYEIDVIFSKELISIIIRTDVPKEDFVESVMEMIK